jgi:hypothetical protein
MCFSAASAKSNNHSDAKYIETFATGNQYRIEAYKIMDHYSMPENHLKDTEITSPISSKQEEEMLNELIPKND